MVRQGDTGEHAEMRVVFVDTMLDALEHDPRLAVVTADISAAAFAKARAR